MLSPRYAIAHTKVTRCQLRRVFMLIIFARAYATLIRRRRRYHGAIDTPPLYAAFRFRHIFRRRYDVVLSDTVATASDCRVATLISAIIFSFFFRCR